MEGVVSVIPNHKLKLHTTRSWDFMGFSKGQLGAPVEGEVIVGLLDTGKTEERKTKKKIKPIENLHYSSPFKKFQTVSIVLG